MHSHSILVLFVTYLVERQRPPLALAAAMQSFKLSVVGIDWMQSIESRQYICREFSFESSRAGVM